tara:strand:- start:666 stop:1232 length:567 start_codon:yes stop_codon:yes gene_type:complete
VPVSKGLRAVGAVAPPDVTPLFEPLCELGDVLDPVDVQSLGVILCANRTINTPQKMNELAMLTSLNPSVVVFLNSAGTLASLTAIPAILSILAQAPILKARTPILSIPNGRDNRGKLTMQLGADVCANGVHVFRSLSESILGYDGLVVGLGVASEAEEKSSNESHDVHDTYLSAGLQADFRVVLRILR